MRQPLYDPLRVKALARRCRGCEPPLPPEGGEGAGVGPMTAILYCRLN